MLQLQEKGSLRYGMFQDPHPNSQEIEEAHRCLIKTWFNFSFSGSKLKNHLGFNLFGHGYLLYNPNKLDLEDSFSHLFLDERYKIFLIVIHLDI